MNVGPAPARFKSERTGTDPWGHVPPGPTGSPAGVLEWGDGTAPRMGKKKDCFGQEDYVCMTPNCPYARECVKVVWEKRMSRVLSRKDAKPAPKRRSPGRVAASG